MDTLKSKIAAILNQAHDLEENKGDEFAIMHEIRQEGIQTRDKLHSEVMEQRGDKGVQDISQKTTLMNL